MLTAYIQVYRERDAFDILFLIHLRIAKKNNIAMMICGVCLVLSMRVPIVCVVWAIYWHIAFIRRLNEFVFVVVGCCCCCTEADLFTRFFLIFWFACLGQLSYCHLNIGFKLKMLFWEMERARSLFIWFEQLEAAAATTANQHHQHILCRLNKYMLKLLSLWHRRLNLLCALWVLLSLCILHTNTKTLHSVNSKRP